MLKSWARIFSDPLYLKRRGKRTMTLGYGDKCCNCHYELMGECPIRPEGKMK